MGAPVPEFWLLNNILAFFLALTFLKMLRLTTLMPGLTLLGLLFIYDIFISIVSPESVSPFLVCVSRLGSCERAVTRLTLFSVSESSQETSVNPSSLFDQV
jgi:hypothetical protein